MSFLELFRKKNRIAVSDEDIVAIGDAKLLPITEVNDHVFSKKLMGDGVAFQFDGDTVTLCSPANGTLSVLFPTGHAFGVTMKNGVELLVHCGLETVNANREGFQTLGKKQGSTVSAGDPIVKVDLKKLKKFYDMTTMLVITDDNGNHIDFLQTGNISKGNSIIIK